MKISGSKKIKITGIGGARCFGDVLNSLLTWLHLMIAMSLKGAFTKFIPLN